MTHSLKYKRAAKKLGTKPGEPGSLLDKLHQKQAKQIKKKSNAV